MQDNAGFKRRQHPHAIDLQLKNGVAAQLLECVDHFGDENGAKDDNNHDQEEEILPNGKPSKQAERKKNAMIYIKSFEEVQGVEIADVL